MANVICLMLVSFQLLGHAQGKERSVEHPTFYRTIQVDGLSIFYGEAGSANGPAACGRQCFRHSRAILYIPSDCRV